MPSNIKETDKERTQTNYPKPLASASASWQRPSPPAVQIFQFQPSSNPLPVYHFLSSPKRNTKAFFLVTSDNKESKTYSKHKASHMRLIFLIRKRKQKNHTSNPEKSVANFFRSKWIPENKKEVPFSITEERQAPSDFSLPTQVLRTLICQTSCPFQRQLSRQEISHRFASLLGCRHRRLR